MECVRTSAAVKNRVPESLDSHATTYVVFGNYQESPSYRDNLFFNL